MPSLPVLDRDAVFAAVTPQAAITAVHAAFVLHRHGEWVMPPKVYLDAPPGGDFRAMPARGGGIAILKWISSFPGNPAAHGLPSVLGVLVVSDLETSEPLAVLDAAAVTALRTGAVAPIAAAALGAAERAPAVIGCGVNGAWTARCLAAGGHPPGVCHDARTEVAEALAAELGWRVGTREEALAQDVVACVTPGAELVVREEDLRPGQLLLMLGADAAGKAEATVDAVAACALVCDEWEQASHGGELSGAVAAGRVTRGEVLELGAVLAGEAPMLDRTASGRPVLFDSTGLAIQDLAIALAVRAAGGY